MHFNHGEFPPEMGKEFEEDRLEFKVVIEFDPFLPENVILDDFSWERFIPKDNYLEKELERQEQEKLEKMVPKRIP